MSDITFHPVDANLSRSACGNYTIMQSNPVSERVCYKLYRNGAEIASESCRNIVSERLLVRAEMIDFASEDASDR